MSLSRHPAIDPESVARMNSAPPDFRADRDLPPGFMSYYRPLHAELAPRRDALAGRRETVLAAAHRGVLPDQRNQMTGPADDAELVVKMLNSGAPGVMLDLEDSMANR